MSRTISVPKRQGGIGGYTRFATMRFFIGSPIISVTVAEYRRGNHGKIKPGVEYLFDGVVVGLDLNLAQLVFPCLLGIRCYLVKIPVCDFLVQVLDGIGHTDRRYAYLNQYRLLLLWECQAPGRFFLLHPFHLDRF